MTTWTEEFARLSEVERKAIEAWQENRHAINGVINGKEQTNAFLQTYARAGHPPHDSEVIGWPVAEGD